MRRKPAIQQCGMPGLLPPLSAGWRRHAGSGSQPGDRRSKAPARCRYRHRRSHTRGPWDRDLHPSTRGSSSSLITDCAPACRAVSPTGAPRHRLPSLDHRAALSLSPERPAWYATAFSYLGRWRPAMAGFPRVWPRQADRRIRSSGPRSRSRGVLAVQTRTAARQVKRRSKW